MTDVVEMSRRARRDAEPQKGLELAESLATSCGKWEGSRTHFDQVTLSSTNTAPSKPITNRVHETSSEARRRPTAAAEPAS